MTTEARTLPQSAYLGLKAASRVLSKSLGGLEGAATCTNVTYQTLGRYQNVNDPNFMPVDVVADLEREAGSPVVTRTLASLTGHVLVKKPDVVGGRDWLRHLGAVSKECGDTISRLSEALADDGIVTADESKRLQLRAEVREAMERLAALDMALEGLEGEARR